MEVSKEENVEKAEIKEREKKNIENLKVEMRSSSNIFKDVGRRRDREKRQDRTPKQFLFQLFMSVYHEVCAMSIQCLVNFWKKNIFL